MQGIESGIDLAARERREGAVQARPPRSHHICRFVGVEACEPLGELCSSSGEERVKSCAPIRLRQMTHGGTSVSADLRTEKPILLAQQYVGKDKWILESSFPA